jgi:hypothetical protein
VQTIVFLPIATSASQVHREKDWNPIHQYSLASLIKVPICPCCCLHILPLSTPSIESSTRRLATSKRVKSLTRCSHLKFANESSLPVPNSAPLQSTNTHCLHQQRLPRSQPPLGSGPQRRAIICRCLLLGRRLVPAPSNYRLPHQSFTRQLCPATLSSSKEHGSLHV